MGNPMVAPWREDTAASLGREQAFDYTIRRKDSPPQTAGAVTSQRINIACLVRFLVVVASFGVITRLLVRSSVGSFCIFCLKRTGDWVCTAVELRD